MIDRPFESAEVAAKFSEYPDGMSKRLLSLRRLILTLKWGRPSYLTTQTGSGSTVRLDRVPSSPGRIALYFHCQSNLVANFRELYSRELRFEGARAILLEAGEAIREPELRHCLSLALTHHLRKRRTRAGK